MYILITKALPCFYFIILYLSLSLSAIWIFESTLLTCPFIPKYFSIHENPKNNSIHLHTQNMIVWIRKFNTDTMVSSTLPTLLKFHQFPNDILLGYYFFGAELSCLFSFL